MVTTFGIAKLVKFAKPSLRTAIVSQISHNKNNKKLAKRVFLATVFFTLLIALSFIQPASADYYSDYYNNGYRYCVGSSVYERMNNMNVWITDCAHGCSSGRCLENCDPQKCDEYDDYYGSAYCTGNSVMKKYRDYYCNDLGNCDYRETEKKLQDCGFGCDGGACKEACDAEVCQSRNGFYDVPFCEAGTVYKYYRSYFCKSSYGNDCDYRQEKILIERCDNGCQGSACIKCDAVACAQKSGFFGDRYCRASDVYRKYRQYECNVGDCFYREIEKQVEQCQYDCQDGLCQDKTCKPDQCDALDGYVGPLYCKDGSVYRNYRDYECKWTGFGSICTAPGESSKLIERCPYGCSGGACLSQPQFCPNKCEGNTWYYGGYYFFNLCKYTQQTNCKNLNGNYGRFCKEDGLYTEKRDHFCTADGCNYNAALVKLENCSCVNDACVGPLQPQTNQTQNITKEEPRNKTTWVVEKTENNFTMDFSEKKEEITESQAKIFNGLFYGRKVITIAVPQSTNRESITIDNIEFFVEKSTRNAPLMVTTNDGTIKSFLPNVLTKYNFTISAQVSAIQLKTLSPLFFWEKSEYEIKNITVHFTKKIVANEFTFGLQNKVYQNFDVGKIETSDKVKIVLNNAELGADVLINLTKNNLLPGQNTLKFMPVLQNQTNVSSKITIFYKEIVSV